MSPQFRNAQHLARLSPHSFEAPAQEMLDQICPGSWAKVSVAFPENEDGMDGERFWVKVTEREGDRLAGTIDNELFATDDHGLRRGDRVDFTVEHVYDVHI